MMEDRTQKWMHRIVAIYMIYSSWACTWFMIAVTAAYLIWMPDATIELESWRFGFALSTFLLFLSLFIMRSWLPVLGITKAQRVKERE